MSCCARCGRVVYYAEQRVALNQVWHAFCFSCCKCRKLLDACSFNTYRGELYCNGCYKCVACLDSGKTPCKRMSCKDPCANCSPCRDCEEVCILPCDPCDLCNSCDSCCKSLAIKPSCCCCNPPSCKPKCPVYICMDECDMPCAPKCRPCSPCSSCPEQSSVCCNCPKPNPCCLPPIPRDTSNYYNRKHEKNCCNCGSCSPKIKCCPPKPCKPHVCCLKRPCTPKVCCLVRPCPPKPCCAPKPCCEPKPCCPKPCPPPKYCPPKPCCKPCCNPCTYQKPCQSDPCSQKCPSGLCCNPCCSPPRKPICYPPVRCCEPPPPERICFFPCYTPSNSKCCKGKPNVCSCDTSGLKYSCTTPCCLRCGQKVFAAEIVKASGGAFHTCCFTCYCCNKLLEVTSVYENNCEIYCKNCYSKLFGLSGYGYGSTLQSNQ